MTGRHAARGRRPVRQDVLSEAERLVLGDRNRAYGDPSEHFAQVAALWSALGWRRDGRPLAASDVAVAMIALKLARLAGNATHRDSWVDVAGYAATGAEAASHP